MTVTVEAIRARLEAVTQPYLATAESTWALYTARRKFDDYAIDDVEFLLAENARKDAIVEQVEAMAKWLGTEASNMSAWDSKSFHVAAHLLDAILAGDTDGLPWA